MGKLKKYYSRLIIAVSISFMLGNYNLVAAQGNCLLYAEDSGERKACELSYKAIEHPQGSKESQLLFDEAIEIGPKYAWAYYQKSVPYFKHGLLNQAIEILNKAIELEPRSYYQCYRAYWYFSHKSYLHCIKDLEKYYFELNGGMEFTPQGDLEMRLLLGMSYAKLGKLDKATEVISDFINAYKPKENIGFYNYYILGVLHYKNNEFAEAKKAFEKQIEIDKELANSYYYLGLISQETSNNKNSHQYFTEALVRFNGEKGGYNRNFLGINVSKSDIEKELAGLKL